MSLFVITYCKSKNVLFSPFYKSVAVRTDPEFVGGEMTMAKPIVLLNNRIVSLWETDCIISSSDECRVSPFLSGGDLRISSENRGKHYESVSEFCHARVIEFCRSKSSFYMAQIFSMVSVRKLTIWPF